MKLAFEKWHGLGNDFIVVESIPGSDGGALARALCDRRLGVGGDGVLLVDGAATDAPRMTVWNADGSRPEMCGNGLRCVAGFLLARRGGGSRTLDVQTDAGARPCTGHLVGDEATVSIGMGRVKLGADLALEGFTFTTADVGNPHAVTFEPADAAAIDSVGPRVSTAPPAGYNVEFCRASAGRIDVVVWERGCGRTQACGTGAVAVAAVACAKGFAAYDTALTIGLPGGDLGVLVEAETRRATLVGPARRVYAGQISVP